jgi:hypothetical protein
MLKDIRYAVRTLLQHSGFAVTSILSIAVAIGAQLDDLQLCGWSASAADIYSKSIRDWH